MRNDFSQILEKKSYLCNCSRIFILNMPSKTF